jgi:hypothetical protein
MGVLEPSNVWPPIVTFKSELMVGSFIPLIVFSDNQNNLSTSYIEIF